MEMDAQQPRYTPRLRFTPDITPAEKAIESFMQSLKRLSPREPARVRSLCMNFVRHLHNVELIKRVNGIAIKQRGYAPVTIFKSYIPTCRNRIRLECSKPMQRVVLRYLKGSAKEQAAVKEVTDRRTIERQKNSRPWTLSSMVWPARLVLNNLDDFPIYCISAALVAVTGRRPYEINKTATFTLPPQDATASYLTKGAPTLLFAGQAKQRNSKNASTDPYLIPTLVDPQLILDAIEYLRINLPMADLGNRKVDNTAGRGTRKYSNALFVDDAGKSLSSKALRAFYAGVTAGRYKPAHVQINAYIGAVLGHIPTDITTSHAYMIGYESNGKNAEDKRSFDKRRRADIRADLERLKKEMAQIEEESGTLKAAATRRPTKKSAKQLADQKKRAAITERNIKLLKTSLARKAKPEELVMPEHKRKERPAR